MSDQLSALRNVYEIGNIQNLVPDGTIPFLVDASEETGSGISVEFRSVADATLLDAMRPIGDNIGM